MSAVSVRCSRRLESQTDLPPIALYNALSCPIREADVAGADAAESLLLGRATGTLAAPVFVDMMSMSSGRLKRMHIRKCGCLENIVV